MTTISQSKARAVLSISFVIFSFVPFVANAQNQQHQFTERITVHYDNITITGLLQKLSETTHLHFIYSSSFLHPDRLISLSLYDRPLEEALRLLELKANLTFKKQGDYVIITPGKPAAQILKSTMALVPVALDTIEKAKSEGLHSYRGNYKSEQVDGSIFLKEYQLYKISIDSMAIREFSIANARIQSSRRRQSNWFASAGFFANDFTAGLEIQAGVPVLHGIVNAGFLNDGSFRKSIGVGSAISLTPQLGVAAKYSYAELQRTQETIGGDYHLVASQQQLRLSILYSITKHIRVHAGPTLNLLTTDATFQRSENLQPVNNFFTSAQTIQGKNGNRYTQTVQTFTLSTPPDYREIKSWIGFEAGVSYSIKIFSRP